MAVVMKAVMEHGNGGDQGANPSSAVATALSKERQRTLKE